MAAAAARAMEGEAGVGKGITINSEEGHFTGSLRLVMLGLVALLLALQGFLGLQARPAGHGSSRVVF